MGSTLEGMSMTVNVPDDLAARLAAEAERRGASVDEVAAELLTAGLPADSNPRPARRHLSFAGIGASGGGEAVGRNHEAILRQAFAGKTARDA
jgi:plasmid stability protein